jgi:two-component system, chemotaxis family, response regulator Rcp1
MSEHFRILIIEDNPGDAELVRELIADTGLEHEITWLRDGEKAMVFFKEGNETDIILLDINVPKVDGHTLMNFLRERTPTASIPVLVMTGSANPMDLAKVTENGAVGYIVKPMTLDEMEQTTKTLKETIQAQRSGKS